MSEALIKAARAALDALTDERMGTCDYMDGDQIYSDFEKVADILRAALAAAQRAGFDPTLTFNGSSNSNQTQAEQTSEPVAVRLSELVGALRYVRTHLYAAQAQMTERDDAIISRHVYDAYKRIVDLTREVELHGVEIPPRPAVRLTDEERADIMARWDRPCANMWENLICAVETAVLRKNNLEVK